MKTNWIVLMLLTVLLAACGEGGGKPDAPAESASPEPNNLPTISVPAEHIEAQELARVELQFETVSDPDGQILQYQWMQVDIGEHDPNVTLQDSDKAVAYFHAPDIDNGHTWLHFTLTVTDDRGARVTSETLDVLVQQVENYPTADAGPDQNVDFSSEVRLDASGSTDADGTITTHQWSQIQGPDVSLTDADSAVAIFTSPAVDSILGFELTITDNHGNSASDSIQIHVVGDRLNPRIKRLPNPGRLELTWNTAGAAQAYNLYYAKGQTVNASNYLGNPGATAVLDVSPPFVIPAAFNEYQNVYFTVEAVVGGGVTARETADTELKDIALDAGRALAFGGCLIEGTQVLCWGDNESYRMRIPDLINPAKVDISHGIGCALDDSGVTCWGSNQWSAPPNNHALTEPVDLHVELDRVCVLDSGERICWSSEFTSPLPELPSYSGAQQLAGRCVIDASTLVCSEGAGEQADMPSFATAPIDADINYRAGEFDGACAIHAGSVSCWGEADYTDNEPLLNNPQHISVGLSHACALDSTGVICWGNHDTPETRVPSLQEVYQVSSGNRQSCAIGAAGLTCWGANVTHIQRDTAQFDAIYMNHSTLCGLANGELVCSTDYPFEQAASYSTVTDFSAVDDSAPLACVIDAGAVDCWSNPHRPWVNVPPTFVNPRLVSVGGYYSGGDARFACGVDDSGVQCWGDAYIASLTPPTLDNISHIESSTQYSCIANATDMKCWGIGEYPDEIQVPEMSDFKDFSINNAGGANICALDGSDVVCWNHAWDERVAPVLANPSQISVGDRHSCALDANGVSCWETEALSGQTHVPTLYNPVQVEAGASKTCALDDYGLICWGNGNFNGFGWRANPRY